MTGKPHVTIYTDGGSEPNPGPGGWGALLIAESGQKKELSGAAPDTTNNRMELTAAIEALRALKQPCHVTLHTDSRYLRDGITKWLHGWIKNGWMRKGDKPVLNTDLWQALHAETRRHAIDWQWVKGHAGDEHNEHVDRLATAARRKLTGDAAPAAPASAEPAAPARFEIALRVSVPKAGGAGGYAFRVYDNDAGTQATHTGREMHTNSSQLVLVAAHEALAHTPEKASVRVYCPDTYLQQGMTQWIDGWAQRGWKTQSGSAVKNQPEWRALAQTAGARSVQWASKNDEPDDLTVELDALASAAARGEL